MRGCSTDDFAVCAPNSCSRMVRDRTLWNHAAPLWAAFQASRLDNYRTEEIRRIVAGVPQPDGLRVLDLGCGEGSLSRALASIGAQVTAIDLSPTMIEAAKRLTSFECGRITYVADDAATWTPTQADYDLVVALFSLFNMYDDDLIIRNIHRMCRRGGLFKTVLFYPGHFDGSYSMRRMLAYEGEREERQILIRWRLRGLPTFFTVFYHRPISRYLGLFHSAGFRLLNVSVRTVSRHRNPRRCNCHGTDDFIVELTLEKP